MIKYWYHIDGDIVMATKGDDNIMPIPWIQITKEMYIDFKKQNFCILLFALLINLNNCSETKKKSLFFIFTKNS